MGLKAFLLIVLAIFLVITSEVAARKLLQRSITSSENGGGVLPVVGGLSGVGGGLLPNAGGLISGLPIVGGPSGVLPKVGGPSGVEGGLLGDLISGFPIIGGLP
ncbi:hypothetical protein AABB24_016571 [Solanum stoloniferum]|uniref:Glycine-rich protein n=1 Tax=Solanum stoloniferum TaxID=62892 RepID=A0ABD2TUL4_9SOLN